MINPLSSNNFQKVEFETEFIVTSCTAVTDLMLNICYNYFFEIFCAAIALLNCANDFFESKHDKLASDFRKVYTLINNARYFCCLSVFY